MKFLILIVALIAYVSAASVGSLDDNLPKEVDWRKHGAITRVKSEGKDGCSADFAFVVAGLLESHYFIKTGKLVELSPQNLIDCYWLTGAGCTLGLITDALIYAVRYGIDTEESYPYKGYTGTCSYNASNVGVKAKDYVEVESDYGDESKLKAAVANIGPVSVVITLTDEVKHYTSGIVSKCEDNPNVFLWNQGMLIVGYGTDNETQQDYWILKNSWGTNWGENGYMRIARNTNDKCGLAMDFMYPIV